MIKITDPAGSSQYRSGLDHFCHQETGSNLNLLDRFLIMMEQQGLQVIICFNKEDMASEEEKEELRHNDKDCGHQLFYEEFTPYADGCRFHGCMHISEPDCLVKEALEEGKNSRSRYENYQLLWRELQEMRRY